MAGRVPQDMEREAVATEMEATFIENLRHAADVLAQVMGSGSSVGIALRMENCRYWYVEAVLQGDHCCVTGGHGGAGGAN